MQVLNRRMGKSPACLLASYILLSSATALAVPISGTIRYRGSHGPVSVSRPIQIYLSRSQRLNDLFENPAALVTSNGGTFRLNVERDGDYFLAYSLPITGYGGGFGFFVGDPFQIFDHQFALPAADPLHVPASGLTGLTLEFDDTGLAQGIAGTVTYTGTHVPDDGSIAVEAFASPDTSRGPVFESIAINGGLFGFVTLDTDPYYVRARLRGEDEDSEPVSSLQRTFAASDKTNVNLTFGDESVGPGTAIRISGTVRYRGSRGPVSVYRPVFVLLLTSPDVSDFPLVNAADGAAVNTVDGSFTLRAATAGEYFLAFFLFTGTDGFVWVGSPFQFYNHRFTSPADTLFVPQSGLTGLNLELDDTVLLSGIAGTVTYTGSLPFDQVDLGVRAFTDATLTQESTHRCSVYAGQSTGRFICFINDTGTYYLRAAAKCSNIRDECSGSPFQIYDNRDAPPGDSVMAGPDQTDINFTFGDENVPGTPSPTPTPTITSPPTKTASATLSPTPRPTPTPGPCIGDCNHDGKVTVDELIRGVNIALGNLPLDQCPEFDCNGSGDATVDCLVGAVNSFLHGCVG